METVHAPSSELDPILYNRTRQSSSIPERLKQQGRYHLLPLYYGLLLSDLWREGVRASGSFRFADHLYRNQASGRFGIGKVLDRIILSLPAARTMRNRYVHSRQEIIQHVKRLGPVREQVRVLAVPSGVPRDLREAAETLRTQAPELFAKVRFHAMDLDPEAHELSRPFIAEASLQERFEWHLGDALSAAAYPKEMDIVTSHGLVDFLSDDKAVRMYRNVRECLRPGGVFITSAMAPFKPTVWLLENLAELRAVYRTRPEIEAIATEAGFTDVSTYHDDVGLLTMLVARK